MSTPTPDRTSEQTSTEETPKEKEASSNSTGMNEWSGERYGTLSLMCVAECGRQSPVSS